MGGQKSTIMKTTEHLTEFLEDTVNLNTTQISLLDDSVSAIQSFIISSRWDPKYSISERKVRGRTRQLSSLWQTAPSTLTF